MSSFRASDPPASDNPESEGFAATVVEELHPDQADLIEIDGQAMAEVQIESLPTIGHVGRYVLKHQLGVGGLGTVYAAIDPLLSRPIAVKTLKLDAVEPSQREALEQALLTEARAAAGLSHPHIVTVYDAGLADQGVYVAMERLQGKDLRQLLASGWRPEPEQAVRIIKRVADALSYAHSKGVIHCDVKPANIFMVTRTQPKLLDFGIAKLVQQGANASTQSDDLGSPYYAAPEQMGGKPLDARVDVYALGVVLYELLTGQRAFAGESLEAIRQAVLRASVPSVRQLNPKVDADLSTVVAKAMARDPNARYTGARQLVRALRHWGDQNESTADSPAPAAKRRWPWMWPTIALALAGLVALMPVLLGKEPAKPEVAVTTSAQTPTPMPAPPAPVVAAPAVDTIAAPASASVAMAAPAETPKQAPQESGAAAGPQGKDLKSAKDATTKPLALPKEARPARPTTTAVPAAMAEPTAPGTVQLAISPWGEVEVDGVSKGTTPPLSRLSLSPGQHRITVRNGEFAPYTTTITVESEQSVTLRHRFGP
jgi:eukaryotic-like serine/threonine-protein kinase